MAGRRPGSWDGGGRLLLTLPRSRGAHHAPRPARDAWRPLIFGACVVRGSGRATLARPTALFGPLRRGGVPTPSSCSSCSRARAPALQPASRMLPHDTHAVPVTLCSQLLIVGSSWLGTHRTITSLGDAAHNRAEGSWAHGSGSDGTVRGGETAQSAVRLAPAVARQSGVDHRHRGTVAASAGVAASGPAGSVATAAGTRSADALDSTAAPVAAPGAAVADVGGALLEGERDIELHADKVAEVVGRARAAEALQLLQGTSGGEHSSNGGLTAPKLVAAAGSTEQAAGAGVGDLVMQLGLDSATRYQVGAGRLGW